MPEPTEIGLILNQIKKKLVTTGDTHPDSPTALDDMARSIFAGWVSQAEQAKANLVDFIVENPTADEWAGIVDHILDVTVGINADKSAVVLTHDEFIEAARDDLKNEVKNQLTEAGITQELIDWFMFYHFEN